MIDKISYSTLGISYNKRESHPFKISGLYVTKSSIYFRINFISSTNVYLQISAKEEQVNSDHEGPFLNISYRGSVVPKIINRIIYNTSSKLKNISFADLLEKLNKRISEIPLNEFSKFTESNSAFIFKDLTHINNFNFHMLESGSDIYEQQNGLNERAMQSERWRMFFAFSEYRRGLDDFIQYKDPFIFVEHGDVECQYAGIGDFISYPWANNLISTKSNNSKYNNENQVYNSYYTNMNDLDVIYGGNNKFSELISLLSKNKNTDLLSINYTCVPMIIGDDVDFYIKKAEKTFKCPIITTNQGKYDPFGPYIKIIKKYMSDYQNQEKIEPSINLIGFLPSKGLDELKILLQKFDIIINESIIPEITVEKLKNINKAEIQVLYPYVKIQDIYDSIFNPAEHKILKAPAPYGINGTLKWIEQILHFTGLFDVYYEKINNIKNSTIQKWDKLKKQTINTGVGIVIAPEYFPYFEDPSKFFGIPILSLLDEMGISIYFAIYKKSQIFKIFWEDKLKKLLPAGNYHLSWFTNQNDLKTWFKMKEFQVVYSDYFYDYRITSSGKSSFSLQLFEPGIEGAFRNFERIITLSKISYYKKYNMYLKR